MEELFKEIISLISKSKINHKSDDKEMYITFTTSKFKFNKFKKELEKIPNKKYILRHIDNKYTINFIN